MSIEGNKRTVRELFNHMNAQALDEAFALLTPDATWWLPTDQVGGRTFGKAEMRNVMGGFYGVFATPPIIRLGRITAEDDRVSVEATSDGGRTKGGASYANTYHFLMQFRDGKIAEIREHVNPIPGGPIAAEMGIEA